MGEFTNVPGPFVMLAIALPPPAAMTPLTALTVIVTGLFLPIVPVVAEMRMFASLASVPATGLAESLLLVIASAATGAATAASTPASASRRVRRRRYRAFADRI